MAAGYPTGVDVARLRQKVSETYDRMAREPNGRFHFHHGPEYAASMLGYDAREVTSLPEESTALFAGVGNPHRIGPIRPGETVLDVGCGAGMDVLLVARRLGPAGRAIGVDMTPTMIERVKRAALKSGLWKIIEVRRGIAEELPVESRSIDVVISNGVLNLSPDKSGVFRELYRVLKPGGRLHLADVVVQRELPAAVRGNLDLWVAGIGGVLPEQELLKLAAQTDFVNGAIVERFDCYDGASVKTQTAENLDALGVNFFARKTDRHPFMTGASPLDPGE